MQLNTWNTSVRACARVLPQFSCDFRRTVFSPNFLFIASLLPAACGERKQKKRLCQREESQWQSFLTRPQHPCYSPKAFSFLSHVKRYWKNCKADENVRWWLKMWTVLETFFKPLSSLCHWVLVEDGHSWLVRAFFYYYLLDLDIKSREKNKESKSGSEVWLQVVCLVQNVRLGCNRKQRCEDA